MKRNEDPLTGADPPAMLRNAIKAPDRKRIAGRRGRERLMAEKCGHHRLYGPFQPD